MQGVLQGFRVVGTGTKLGKDYPVVAYRYGGAVELEKLLDYIPDSNGEQQRIQALMRKSRLSLAEAKEKYPELVFEQGNMVTYESDRQFDLVTSTCDAMNHVLEPADLQQVMRNVYSYLAPGGYFLFDLLKWEETEECEPVDLGELDGKRLQFQIHRTADGLVSLQIEVFEGRQLVHTEVIRERIYDAERILQMLTEAGFSKVRYTDRLLDEESNPASTWFVIARKEKH